MAEAVGKYSGDPIWSERLFATNLEAILNHEKVREAFPVSPERLREVKEQLALATFANIKGTNDLQVLALDLVDVLE